MQFKIKTLLSQSKQVKIKKLPKFKENKRKT